MADKALKTSVFIWEGTDKKGSKVKGELTGQNPMLVKPSYANRVSIR